MTITASITFKETDGSSERRELHADFTAENEFANAEGNQSNGIAGRAVEIKLISAGLLEALLDGIEDEGFLPPDARGGESEV